MQNDLFIVSTEPLKFTYYLECVRHPRYGAVASFTGTVRSPNLGETVHYIDYEGYEDMIRTQMQVLSEELRNSYDLGHLVLAHRLGRLLPGEASVAVVVSSVHRKDALAACEQGINRIKELLPIWKYEVSEKGKAWVKGSTSANTPL